MTGHPPLSIVIVGLTLSSSWGNGHATTWRALIQGLRAEGHRVLFLERDKPWYAAHRDLPEPDFCMLDLYDEVADLEEWRDVISRADAVIVGSYVPDGVAVIDLLADFGTTCLCFYDIDTPITMRMLREGQEEYLAPRQAAFFDIYFSFSGGDVLETLERDFSVRRAEALYCCVDETRYVPTGEAAEWDLGYLGTYSPDRQPTLDRLLLEPARRLPGKRFVVAGPGYPGDIDWPANVERIDHLPPAEHPSFYSRQKHTLNVTRADMVEAGWSPSVRLFEAAACGTPLVSDFWRGLDALFPDREAIVIAGGSDDVALLLEESDEIGRLARAAEARRIVLERHTGRARARELVQAIRSIRRPRLQNGGM